jgi:hypothetical protein
MLQQPGPSSSFETRCFAPLLQDDDGERDRERKLAVEEAA